MSGQQPCRHSDVVFHKEEKQMTRKMFIVMVALFAAVAFAASVAVAADPPGKVTVDKAKDKKGAVTFDHAAHMKAYPKCVECHHEAKDEAAVKAIKSCFECHGKDPKAKGDLKAKNNDNPMHKNCVGCHKELKKAKSDSKAPTKCKDCHGGADE
jgi:cytochrome c553